MTLVDDVNGLRQMLGLQATPERLCLAMMVNHGESRMRIPCRDKGQ